MIDPRELRIGNMIFCNGKALIVAVNTIQEIIQDRIKPPETRKDKWEPIPLTEEWLERFGFTNIDEDGLWQSADEELFQIQSEYLNEQWGHIWDAEFTNAPFEYVHQLQNLYFVLTGRELELKEKP